MLNDFLPVIHKIPMFEHPNRMTLIPISDAHYGSREFNEARWNAVMKRIAEDDDCFFVIVGDMLNNGIKTSVSNVYEEVVKPGAQKEWLYNELKPIAGKLLGAVGGNHERRSTLATDQDPLFDVMLWLGKENVYRQNICFMRVSLTYNSNGEMHQRHGYSFAITHGSGGGMYIGSSANKVQNFGMAIEGIDCLITGHTHKPVSFPVSKLVFDDGRVSQKQFVVAVASSFLDYGGYPVAKLLTPTAQTTTEIIMTYTAGTPKSIRVMQ